MKKNEEGEGEDDDNNNKCHFGGTLYGAAQRYRSALIILTRGL